MGGLRVKMYASQSIKKKVLNYEVQSLFIEARRLKKIGADDQSLNPDTSFCEMMEIGMHNRHSKAVEPKPIT